MRQDRCSPRMYKKNNVENVSLLDIQYDRKLFKALSPLLHGRHSNCPLNFPQFPFRIHILVQLAYAFYLLFISLSCACSSTLRTLSLSVLFTAFPSLSSPLNLKSEFFPLFSYDCLATISTAYIFYICLYVIVCVNVCLLFVFHADISF